MLASLLALLASLSWGTSDFMAGMASRRMSAWGVALVTQALSAAGAAALLLVSQPATPSAGLVAVLLLGGVAGAVGVVGQYRAFTITKLSVVSAIIAGAALLPALWSIVTIGRARVDEPRGDDRLGRPAAARAAAPVPVGGGSAGPRRGRLPGCGLSLCEVVEAERRRRERSVRDASLPME